MKYCKTVLINNICEISAHSLCHRESTGDRMVELKDWLILPSAEEMMNTYLVLFALQ